MKEVDNLPPDVLDEIRRCDNNRASHCVDNGGCVIWPDTGKVRTCIEHGYADVYISPSMAVSEYRSIKADRDNLDARLLATQDALRKLLWNLPPCGSCDDPATGGRTTKIGCIFRSCDRHRDQQDMDYVYADAIRAAILLLNSP